MWQDRKHSFIAAALVAFFVIAAAASVWEKSSSWDEPFHLTAGVAQLQSGDPRLSMDHPPLARLLAALPALFMDIPVAVEQESQEWKSADVIRAPNAFFGTIEDDLLWPARLSMLALALLLGWIIHAWATQLFGLERAWLPLALFALCPLFLANAPLVATDMAATTTMFASFYCWWRYLQTPSAGWLAWTCLSVAAAFSAKYSAILLVPSFLFLGLVALFAPSVLRGEFKQRLRILAGALLVVGATTLLGINVIYFFDGVFLKPADYVARAQDLVPAVQPVARELSAVWPAWLAVPLPFYYVMGLLSQVSHVGQQGHWTYFLGEAGSGGWANYFPLLLLVKLPIATLILIGLGLLRALSRLPRDWWNLLFLALPPLFLIWIASNGTLNIGIRHILPALPFLFLLAAYVFRGGLNRWRVLVVGGLLAASGVSGLSVHPHYLMYFNFLAGGPERGWRISVNADDWGQGDADLARWLQARGVTELAYLPFGWGQVVLNRAGISTRPVPCEDTGALVAVHAGALLTPITFEDNQCYLWMRLREPDEKIGYNIFLYNSDSLTTETDMPDARQSLVEGLDLYAAEKYVESITASRKSLQLDPDNATAYNNICAAFNSLGDWEDAIQACSKALELEPNFELARRNLVFAQENEAAEERK